MREENVLVERRYGYNVTSVDVTRGSEGRKAGGGVGCHCKGAQCEAAVRAGREVVIR